MRIEDNEDIYAEVSDNLSEFSSVYQRIEEGKQVRKYEILHVIECARGMCELILDHLDEGVVESGTEFNNDIGSEITVDLVGRGNPYAETETTTSPLTEYEESETFAEYENELDTGIEDYTGESSLDEVNSEQIIFTILPDIIESKSRFRSGKINRRISEDVEDEEMEYEEVDEIETESANKVTENIKDKLVGMFKR